MTLCRAQVIIPSSSGLTADHVTNNWGVELDVADLAGTANFTAVLKTFYEAWSGLRSTQFTWSQARVKYYDLTDPEPRVPFADSLLTLTSAAGTDTLPLECAICMSFAGVPTSGAPPARRRGRLYLGPLSRATTLATDGRVASTAVTTIVNAANTMSDASGLGDWTWCIISPTGGLDGVPVFSGWVDNEFDTVRRRGRKATSRTTWVS